MLVTKKRIRNLASNLKGVRPGQEILIALTQPERYPETLSICGFSNELEPGETVLPKPVGPVSGFNAEGRYKRDKTGEMETAYRQVEWSWEEFHGPYDRVERTDIREIPYQRWPRRYTEPPAIELSVATSAEGKKLIVSPQFEYVEREHDRILHTINVFLELFAECSILDSQMNAPIRTPLRRLNWQVLPPGRMPWDQLKKHLAPVIQSAPDGNQPVLERRFGRINAHEPKFTAIGQAGFSGYVVFGFPDRDLYVLESTQTNNATYIFRENWEQLSTLSKAEILRNDLHERRVIHRANWFDEIDRVLMHAK